MKKLLLLLLLLWCSPVFATTYYVSQSTANGYALGDDANNGLAKSTPFLTFGKARVTATNTGDVIIFNDGTYLCSAGASGQTYFGLVHSVTWQAENTRQVIWKANHATQTIVPAPSAGKNPTVVGIVIDATGEQQAASCVKPNANWTGQTLTFTDCSFINFVNSGIITGATYTGGNFVFTRCVFTSTLCNVSTGSNGIYLTSINGTNITISDCTFTMSSSANYTLRGINILCTNGPVNIDGVTLDMTTAGTGSVIGVDVTGYGSEYVSTPKPTITDITGTVTAVNNLAVASIVNLTDIGGVTISNVHDATATGAGPTYIVKIIDDSFTISDHVITNCTGNTLAAGNGYAYIIQNSNNGLISDCVATGVNNGTTDTPHGASIVNSTGGRITRCTFTKFSPAIQLLQTDATTIADYNVVINCHGEQALYNKSVTGSIFDHNTVYMSSEGSGMALASRGYYGDEREPSVNATFTSNIVYIDAASPKFVYVAPDNTAVFSNNLYYSTQDLISTSWVIGGVASYATFATWKNAQEAVSFYGDPLFTSSSNYYLQSSSPAINQGLFRSTTTDRNGVNTPIGPNCDIGAYEFQYSYKNDSGLIKGFELSWDLIKIRNFKLD